MNTPAKTPTWIQRFQRRPLVYLAAVLVLILLGFFVLSRFRKPAQVQSFYQVKRGDFLVSIVEGGTIEAVKEVVIRSEVEGVARIINIVPEGTYVKKDTLLIELDSSSSQDAVNQQQINVEKAQFAMIQAEQQLEIQKSVVDSEIQAAELKVEFAQIDLDKYIKGEAEQLRRNSEIAITEIEESLKIAQERLLWSENLYTNGFESKGNLDSDRLSVTNKLLTLEKNKKALWMLQTFDEPKQKRQLESLLEEAKENLERVKLQGTRRLAQYEADLETQKKTLKLSQDKLERDKRQLAATKILAPQDGLVVYASAGGGRFSSESMVEEGATVRNRQELIKLPDVSSMKLLVKIHESHINQVTVGQPAFVVLDSLPDQRFQGAVNKVAPLPDSQSRWANPDLKVYVTEILLTDKLPNVKPGVSARAEIVITNLANVLTAPIQAVTTRKGRQVCYLAGNSTQPVPVTVGQYNTKFIEIVSGLNEGDRVLLAPPPNTEDKDLGGSIIADGEAPPPSATNRSSRLPPPAQTGTGHDNGRANGFPAAASAPTAGPNGAADLPGSRGERSLRTGEGGGGMGGPPGDGSMTGRRSRPGGDMASRTNRQAMMLKQYDKNGDGNLDEEERAAMRQAFETEMIKQFDKNGDGKLDEQERAAMPQRMGRGPRSDSTPSGPPGQ